MNRPDILQREGNYPVPKTASDLPGLEVSGIVVDKGKSVSRFKIGEKVCALCHGGGYSEYWLWMKTIANYTKKHVYGRSCRDPRNICHCLEQCF